MKTFSRFASLLILTGVIIVFANCGGDDPAAPPEKGQLEKLSKTWNIVSASLDGNNRTADFTNFKLTISGTFNTTTPEGPYQYSVSGSRPTPSPWPANGTWTFTNVGSSGDTGSLLRNDGVPMIYTISSNGQLTISDLICTNCENYPGGRTEQVNGKWTFVFN